MNKTYYIIIAIVLVLIVAISLTLTNQNSDTDINITDVVYTDLDITFKPSEGSNIVTENFFTDQSVKADTLNPGLYELGNTITIDPVTGKLPLYVAIFDKQSGVFNISLLQQPFSRSRIEAEVYLKNLLQISEEELCKLSYSVTVPEYVSRDASGFDYRFSFCPGSIPL